MFAIPSLSARQLLLLGSLMCCGLASAAQDDALSSAQLQLERMAKASLMAERGTAKGFVQLRDSQMLLAGVMASLDGRDTFEGCTNHVPYPVATQKLHTIAAKLPALSQSAAAVLGHETDFAQTLAASKAIADATPRMGELLGQLQIIEAESSAHPRDSNLMTASHIVFLNERAARFAMRFVQDARLEPEIAFVVSTHKKKMSGYLDDLLLGSKQHGILPPTPKAKAKVQEIIDQFALEATSFDVMDKHILATLQFKTAAFATLDAAEEMGDALASVRSDMVAHNIYKH